MFQYVLHMHMYTHTHTHTHCHSYTNYNKKPVSIVDILGMTLKFIHEQDWAEERGEEESAGKRPRTSLHPLPRFISSQELSTMETCIDRWTKELTQDIEGLVLMCTLVKTAKEQCANAAY